MHPLAIARTAIKDHGAIQKDAELAGFLALAMDLNPLEVVVEVGSYDGGTSICRRRGMRTWSG